MLEFKSVTEQSMSHTAAAIVNRCSICNVTFVTPVAVHRSTDFHKMNLLRDTKLSVEDFAKKKRITVTKAKQLLASPRDAEPSNVQTSAADTRSGHTENQFVPRGTIIKRTVQEHSHNNHHGLPGANRYSHRGPCSAPGQTNMFRGKKN